MMGQMQRHPKLRLAKFIFQLLKSAETKNYYNDQLYKKTWWMADPSTLTNNPLTNQINRKTFIQKPDKSHDDVSTLRNI